MTVYLLNKNIFFFFFFIFQNKQKMFKSITLSKFVVRINLYKYIYIY